MNTRVRILRNLQKCLGRLSKSTTATESGVGYRKILCTLLLLVVLSLLVTAIPAMPALAADISLSPSSGPPGTEITLTARAFSPAHEIAILFDGYEQAFFRAIATTFTYTLKVPTEKVPGTYLVEVIDYSLAIPGRIASASFIVTVAGEISLYPRRGTVGTEVKVKGEGFVSGEGIIVEYDGDEIDIDSGDTKSDELGDFTSYITVPESTAGDHNITIIGEDSGAEVSDKFTVTPAIYISPAAGIPNTKVTISGNGFGRRAEVFIYFAGNEIAIDDTDVSGSFKLTVSITEKAPGTYNVEVEDDNGNRAEPVEFVLEAKADISKTEGYVGAKITVSGIGFKASGAIKINYDGINVATTTADDVGAFSTSFNVPASSGGSHTVAVTDGDIKKEFTFVMESVPPPIPALQTPASGIELTEAAAYFNWNDVNDPSGVSYNFQIASAASFAENLVVLETKNITSSEYTLTEKEWEGLIPSEESEETRMTYYWRVQATDGAFNESSWSSTRTFFVTRPGAGLPQWTIYLLIGLGVIIIGLIIGFWIGRRK